MRRATWAILWVTLWAAAPAHGSPLDQWVPDFDAIQCGGNPLETHIEPRPDLFSAVQPGGRYHGIPVVAQAHIWKPFLTRDPERLRPHDTVTLGFQYLHPSVSGGAFALVGFKQVMFLGPGGFQKRTPHGVANNERLLDMFLELVLRLQRNPARTPPPELAPSQIHDWWTYQQPSGTTLYIGAEGNVLGDMAVFAMDVVCAELYKKAKGHTARPGSEN